MNSIRTLHARYCVRSSASILVLALMVGTGCYEPESVDANFSLGQFDLVDLTHTFNQDTIYWPTDEDGFVLEEVSKGMTDGGYYYEASKLRTAEHGGTHLDAPVHFAEGGDNSDEIPLERLVANAVVVDVSAKCADQPDYLVSVADVLDFEAQHGAIPDGNIVLIRTGYSAFWPDRERYLGTSKSGQAAIPELHFPGIDPALADWLTTKRNVASVGIDTPSIDAGQSTEFMTHRILFAENIPGFENVANLDRLPPTGSIVAALAMKIEGGSGGPLRIIAMVPKSQP